MGNALYPGVESPSFEAMSRAYPFFETKPAEQSRFRPQHKDLLKKNSLRCCCLRVFMLNGQAFRMAGITIS